MAKLLMSCVIVVIIFAATAQVVDANAFLRARPAQLEERISEADVQTSLLSEVEGTFGAGSASSRTTQLEAQLAPMYAALPKNEQGYLGHATVRYALHRLFVQRHGWSIKGLDTAGGHRNSTSSAGLLKEQVPAYIQDLFEQRLAGRGFGLHELSVLAATVEHLVHSEAIKRLGNAFKVHNFLPTDTMNEKQADEVLDTYMTSYILGADLSKMTLKEALDLKAEMPGYYMAWDETMDFVHSTRRNITETESTADQKASGQLDFSLVARVAERVGERFGSFQNNECRQIKASLVSMEERSTGRVTLAEFYKPAVDGHWQFQESATYLRQLGALDESDSDKPRVIIANYVGSASNCIASSSFYSVCCKNECEGLLGDLERQIAAPEASTARITELVSELMASEYAGQLSPNLIKRLEDIAAEHGGSVPLHGRLFAQWMHNVFPRECPYPHLSGTTNPQTADEWFESTGEETTATSKEMWMHIAKAEMADVNKKQEDTEESSLQWCSAEELLVERPQQPPQPPQPPQAPQSPRGNSLSIVRNLLMIASMLSVAYGVVQRAKSEVDRVGADKLMV